MGRTLSQLSQEMSSEEFAWHMADFARDPWDPSRGDLQAAIVAATLGNIHRKKGAPPLKPVDFMPYAEQNRPREVTDPAEFFGE